MEQPQKIIKYLVFTTILLLTNSFALAKDNYDKHPKKNTSKKVFKLEVKGLEEINKSQVPAGVKLIDGFPIYKLALTENKGGYLPPEAKNEEQSLSEEPMMLGQTTYAQTQNPPQSGLFIQYDPRQSPYVFLSWYVGPDIEHGLIVNVNGSPILTQPPIALNDPKIYYYGESNGYGIWPSTSGSYSFSIATFKDGRYQSYYSSTPVNVVAAPRGKLGPAYPPTDILISMNLVPYHFDIETDIGISWDHTVQGLYKGLPPNVLNYEYRYRFNGGQWTNWFDIGLTGYIAKDNAVAGDYEFQIVACNETGCSYPANTGIKLIDPPSTPQLSFDYNAGEAGFKVHWQSTSGGAVSRYYLKENEQGNGWSSSIEQNLKTTKEYKSMLPGTYYYKVQACNKRGCSLWSNSVSVVVGTPFEQCPANL